MKTTQEKYTELLLDIKLMVDEMGYESFMDDLNDYLERDDVDDYEDLSEWLITEEIWDRETDRWWYEQIFYES